MKNLLTAALAASMMTLGGVALAAAAPTAATGAKTDAAAPAASPAAAPPAETTLKGEVLDSTCFFTQGASGESHKACALGCLKKGAVPSFQAEDGSVYLLIAEHGKEKALEDAKKLAGEKVELTGTVAEKGGMKAFIITSAKKAA